MSKDAATTATRKKDKVLETPPPAIMSTDNEESSLITYSRDILDVNMKIEKYL